MFWSFYVLARKFEKVGEKQCIISLSVYTPYIRFGENRRIRKKTDVYQSACVLAGEYYCLFFSFLYSLIARETKQAFWIHLTA